MAKGTYQLYIVYPNTEIVADGPSAPCSISLALDWGLSFSLITSLLIISLLIIAHRKLGFIIFFLFWIFFVAAESG